jgi:outer membrane protein assembly factor BamA
MLPFSRVLAALTLFTALSLAAQIYTPKEIHLEGVPDSDVPGFLKILNLQPGTDITKQQIEEALQRLGDTGLFSNIQYTVSAKALTIQLSTAASAKPLPVRFGNFVWWQPAELEKLVEARVPLYHGELPINGSLMDQVQAALVDLLREKGITGKVTASEVSEHPGAPISATAIYITVPIIQLGDLHLQNVDPALQAKIDQRTHTLGEEDFDIVVTSNSLQQNIADVYQNAGYLDIATDPPTFSAPRKDPAAKVQDRYLVDASTAVHPGQVYRIANLIYPAAPPLTQPEIAAATHIKSGDIASPLSLRLADDELKRAYGDCGYLGAAVSHAITADSSAHTASYTFRIVPGDIYHLAGVDASALTAAQQTTFAQTFHVANGVVADKAMRDQLIQALSQMNLMKTTVFNLNIDNSAHTVVYILKPRQTHS